MIDTTLLEEQITRFEQIIDEREKKIELLKPERMKLSQFLKYLRKKPKNKGIGGYMFPNQEAADWFKEQLRKDAHT